MNRAGIRNDYVVHGVKIIIDADDPALAAVLHARLSHFAVERVRRPHLHFEYRSVPQSHPHVVEKPPYYARAVYDPPIGEVVYFDGEDLLYIEYGEQVRVLSDLGSGHTRISMRSPVEDNHWLLSHPLFTIPLMEQFKRRKCYSLHAAGLSWHGRTLLFPGTSGAGKSTLTVALLRAGFDFLADDTVFLIRRQEEVRALAFPDEVDVTDDTLSFFPELRPLASQAKAHGWNKRQIRVEEFYGSIVTWQSNPVAVISPRIAGTRKSFLEPMGRDEALLTLAPNVLLTDASSSQAHLDLLARLVHQADCYCLHTGTDFDTIPALLRDMLQGQQEQRVHSYFP